MSVVWALTSVSMSHFIWTVFTILSHIHFCEAVVFKMMKSMASFTFFVEGITIFFSFSVISSTSCARFSPSHFYLVVYSRFHFACVLIARIIFGCSFVCSYVFDSYLQCEVRFA